jgi:Cysteine-rich secretory protein family
LAARACRLLPLLLLLAFAQLFAQAAQPPAPEAEQEILRLVNGERQSRGLAPLVGDPRLQQAARQHSQRMAALNQLGHQLAGEPQLELRLGQRKLRFSVSGENVAVAADAGRAHTALMHSPPHRANILDREYDSVGIGVVGTERGIYVTQDFARLLPSASVEDVEEQVALHLNRCRSAAGAPSLRRVQAPELRRRACEMAARDQLNPRAGMLPRASGSVAFTAIDLTQIPESLHNLRSHPASAFSVGACYQSSATYENPVFWVLVVTYL